MYERMIVMLLLSVVGQLVSVVLMSMGSIVTSMHVDAQYMTNVMFFIVGIVFMYNAVCAYMRALSTAKYSRWAK